MQTPAQEFGFTASQAEALLEHACDLVDAGDLQAAAVTLSGLVALNPLDASLRAALGSVLHQQGKLHEASAAYDEALRLHPGAALARVNRGELWCQGGDPAGLAELRRVAASPGPVQRRAVELLRRYSR